MQSHYASPGAGEGESELNELFGTLWAISVITRRMACRIYTLWKKKGEAKHEQNVRTVNRRSRAPQMW